MENEKSLCYTFHITKEKGDYGNKKTASKTSKKASVNFDWNNNSKQNKRNQKKVNKQLKKLSIGAIMIAVLLLVAGSVGGFFGVNFMTKDDCFALNGKDEITLQIGENYTDDGAKVIAFGKDVSNKVKVETDLTLNDDGTYTAKEEGTYYMIYTVDHFKYGSLFKIQKIRLITFVEATEQDEIDNANQGGNA